MRPSATTLACLVGAFVAAPRLSAQSSNFIPVSGRYVVTGQFQGMEMDPWNEQWAVRDTVVDGKKTVAITHITTRIAPPSTFTSTVLLDPATGKMVSD